MKINLLVVNILSLLAFPTVGWAQAPNLGTTSSFALFTANGALTNVGSSTVAGDIGTNVGAFSGFNSATVTGSTHVGDASSGSVAVDVVTAYNSVTATPCSTTLSSPELGSQTLTPGVYCQVTALPTTLTGTLTLSGSGVFIFKLSSALTTADLSSIVLTDGARADNVYFQILGAATIGVTPTAGGAGSGSGFVGTILAMGAIVLNNTTLQGRALSTAGAITVNESNVIIPSSTMPDLTPIIYARSSNVRNTSPITVVVDVLDLLNEPSSGLITVRVTRDSQASLIFNPDATSIDNRSVQNKQWTYIDTDPTYYVLTTTGVIAADNQLSFGFTGTLTPGATTGSLTFSTTVVGGGEVRVNNNSDADKIDYFQ